MEYVTNLNGISNFLNGEVEIVERIEELPTKNVGVFLVWANCPMPSFP